MSAVSREPEARQAGQHAALVRDRRRQDDVEGAMPVAGDQQQPVVVDRVEVADLAGADERIRAACACIAGSGSERRGLQSRPSQRRVGPWPSRRGAGRRHRRSRRPALGRASARRRRSARWPADRARAGARRRPAGRCAGRSRRPSSRDRPPSSTRREQDAAAGVQAEARARCSRASAPAGPPGRSTRPVIFGPACSRAGSWRRAGSRARRELWLMSRSCHSGWSSIAGAGVAAQQARQPGDPLGQDRVALVGHRRAALLAGPERLHDLADLGVLEVADLGREPLERAAGDGDRGQERGVAVALDDLGADRVRGAGPSSASTSASRSGSRWL